jgi:hypothetical protein
LGTSVKLTVYIKESITKKEVSPVQNHLRDYQNKKERVMRRVLLLVISVSLLVGCHKKYVDKNLEVESVFYHERGHYSFFAKGVDLQLVPYDYGSAAVRLYMDVPEGHPMWIHVEQQNDPWYGTATQLQIHIYSAGDIAGAGWDHGKFGSGTTTRITP